MKFSVDKCYAVHATNKRNVLLTIQKMNGRPLEVASSHTNLGIGICNKLSWVKNVCNTDSKANKVLTSNSMVVLSYHL